MAAGERLHVTEQGAMILRWHDTIQVRKADTTLATARIADLDVVALYGMIHLNAHAREALLRAGVEIVMLTMAGEFVGRFATDTSPRKRNAWRQLERFDEPGYTLDLARRCVAGKGQQLTLLSIELHADSRWGVRWGGDGCVGGICSSLLGCAWLA